MTSKVVLKIAQFFLRNFLFQLALFFPVINFDFVIYYMSFPRKRESSKTYKKFSFLYVYFT
ncbi:MAG: hypothetical protein ACEY3D_01420 [Rickettsia sp.]|uniref:hypothetical protein n=1 Tax=Rickettsia sp. TaxID=789 RepID=UPI00397DFD40